MTRAHSSMLLALLMISATVALTAAASQPQVAYYSIQCNPPGCTPVPGDPCQCYTDTTYQAFTAGACEKPLFMFSSYEEINVTSQQIYFSDDLQTAYSYWYTDAQCEQLAMGMPCQPVDSSDAQGCPGVANVNIAPPPQGSQFPSAPHFPPNDWFWSWSKDFLFQIQPPACTNFEPAETTIQPTQPYPYGASVAPVCAQGVETWVAYSELNCQGKVIGYDTTDQTGQVCPREPSNSTLPPLASQQSVSFVVHGDASCSGDGQVHQYWALQPGGFKANCRPLQPQYPLSAWYISLAVQNGSAVLNYSQQPDCSNFEPYNSYTYPLGQCVSVEGSGGLFYEFNLLNNHEIHQHQADKRKKKQHQDAIALE